MNLIWVDKQFHNFLPKKGDCFPTGSLSPYRGQAGTSCYAIVAKAPEVRGQVRLLLMTLPESSRRISAKAVSLSVQPSGRCCLSLTASVILDRRAPRAVGLLAIIYSQGDCFAKNRLAMAHSFRKRNWHELDH